MNENEQLARWLGCSLENYGRGDFWVTGGPIASAVSMFLPTIDRMRQSSEWAGAVLEKLQSKYLLGMNNYPDMNKKKIYAGVSMVEFCDPAEIAIARGDTWRDAVVDAALEVIRRKSGNANKS